MNRTFRWYLSVFLVTIFSTSQAFAAHWSTLSVGGVEKMSMPNYSVAKTMVLAQADTTSQADVSEEDAGMCKVDTDCDQRGYVCLDGACLNPEEMSAEQTESKYDLEANDWAFYGGLVGHLLWGGGLIMGAVVADPTHGSAFGVWGLHTASTIVATIGANSAFDNVGVYGAYGQRIASWIFFASGVVTFVVLQVLIAVEDPINQGLNTLGQTSGSGLQVNNGTVQLMMFPAMASGILMSSVALRANRSVRRVKRRAGREEAFNELEKPAVSVGLNMSPYIADKSDPSFDGLMSNLTLRF